MHLIWTVAEPGIYLISACLMTYRPLLDKLKIIPLTSTKIRDTANRLGLSDKSNTSSKRRRQDMELDTDDGTIALRSMNATAGFSQLEDESDKGSLHGRHMTSKNAIVATTKINVSWAEV